MKNLYFLRHGESVYNKKMLVAGTIETPLTDLGKQQALNAAKSAKKSDLEINLIISSPQKRALDTAKIFAKEIGYPNIDIVLSDTLRERNFGVREGEPFYKPGTKDWAVTFEELNSMEGVETLEELEQRSQKILDWVKSLPQENILLISHGAIGRALRRQVEGKPWSDEYNSDFNPIPNAEIVKFI